MEIIRFHNVNIEIVLLKMHKCINADAVFIFEQQKELETLFGFASF